MLIKIDEKKYGDKTVYKNFSLSVAEGKITCILGESGSGKTTLLNCVAGLSPFVGEIPALKCSCVFQKRCRAVRRSASRLPALSSTAAE